jgi:propanol-preferring alcohol dehydrogenase
MTSDSARAMVLARPRTPLVLEARVPPPLEAGQVLIRVLACGVCRTDLHIVDGELDQPKLPLVLGHEIVGRVEAVDPAVARLRVGDRVGVPWLGWTDTTCRFCLRGQENLCEHARFTGYTIDGGYADYTVADADYCLPVPDAYDAPHAAPLMCAGLIGYRTLRLAGAEAERIGFYGFGAAAHIVAQVAAQQGRSVFAFTRPGDEATQAFARELGAVWAGGSDQLPPVQLDAALIFAPVGELVIAALRATGPGGVVVCGGIYMSAIPSFPYRLLWQERVVRSVANLTRQDGADFMRLAGELPLRTEVRSYALTAANAALDDLRHGRLHGAAVLVTGAA